jgi:hypothetical protein
MLTIRNMYNFVQVMVGAPSTPSTFRLVERTRTLVSRMPADRGLALTGDSPWAGEKSA